MSNNKITYLDEKLKIYLEQTLLWDYGTNFLNFIYFNSWSLQLLLDELIAFVVDVLPLEVVRKGDTANNLGNNHQCERDLWILRDPHTELLRLPILFGFLFLSYDRLSLAASAATVGFCIDYFNCEECAEEDQSRKMPEERFEMLLHFILFLNIINLFLK